ncbi:uncharacterized protein [Amphiura filiformis]|uniref:uncharacterized protein n=1 Tax=Amphiura filiformis TaxID=82378 RepID=UPI003B2251CC
MSDEERENERVSEGHEESAEQEIVSKVDLELKSDHDHDDKDHRPQVNNNDESNPPSSSNDDEVSFLRPRQRRTLSSKRMTAEQAYQIKLEEIQLEKLRIEQMALDRERDREEAAQRRAHEEKMAQIQGSPFMFAQGVPSKPKVQDAKVKVPTFSEGDKIDTYLEQFEKIARLCKWDKESWVLRLAPKLTGLARDAYNQLEPGYEANYDRLKEALLHKYELNAEAYRRKFRNSEKGENQSVKEWLSKLSYNFSKWMELTGVPLQAKEAKAVRDQMIIDQAYGKLPRELVIYLKEKEPKTTGDFGKWADAYIERMGGKRWYLGAIAKKTASSNKPKYVPDRDTDKRKEKDRGSRRDKDVSMIKCYVCHQFGHFATKCPNKVREFVPAKMGQHNTAAKFQHVDHSMFLMPGQINGIDVTIWRDSGCDKTIVDKKFVSPAAYTGGTTSLQQLKGELILPLATIQSNGKYGEAQFTVAVLDFEGHEQDRCKVALPPSSPAMVTSKDQTIAEELEPTKQDALHSPAKPIPIPSLVTTRAQKKLDDAELANQDATNGARPKSSIPNYGNDQPGTQARFSGWLNIDPEKLAQLQQADPSLAGIKDRLVSEKNVATESTCYYMKKNIMYRKWTSQKNASEFHQVLVPKQCRKDIMQLGHDVPIAGHMGINKTRERILASFFWPGVFKDIADYCKTCNICQKTAQIRPTNKAPLQPMPIITKPFKRIGMDILGPLQMTTSKKRYILVIVDYATRFPVAVPLSNIRSSTIAEELSNLFCFVGIPDELISDQASDFKSKLIEQVCELMSITHLFSTPYHPETNGLVERFNGTLKSMLKTLTPDQFKTWDKYVPYFCFAYREVPQSSTGFSPFELLYPYPVRGPLEIVKQAWTNQDPDEMGIVKYVADMRSRLADMMLSVHSNMNDAQVKQKTWYDQKARLRTFESGQQVLVLLPSEASKVAAEWQGPYVVTKKISDHNYEITMGKKNKILHVNLLAPYHERKAACYKVTSYEGPDPGHEEDLYSYEYVLNDLDDQQDDVEEESDTEVGVVTVSQTQNWEDVDVSKDITDSQQGQMTEILQKYSKVFSDVPGRQI